MIRLILSWSPIFHFPSKEICVWTKKHLRNSLNVWYWDISNRSFASCEMWLPANAIRSHQISIRGVWRPGEHLRLFFMFFEPLSDFLWGPLLCICSKCCCHMGMGDLSAKMFRWVESVKVTSMLMPGWQFSLQNIALKHVQCYSLHLSVVIVIRITLNATCQINALYTAPHAYWNSICYSALRTTVQHSDCSCLCFIWALLSSYIPFFIISTISNVHLKAPESW